VNAKRTAQAIAHLAGFERFLLGEDLDAFFVPARAANGEAEAVKKRVKVDPTEAGRDRIATKDPQVATAAGILEGGDKPSSLISLAISSRCSSAPG